MQSGRRVGEWTQTWWGEAPEKLCHFDEDARLLSLNIQLHQRARRAAVYRVNKVKRFVRPIHATISRAKPRDDRHGRPMARHAYRSSVALSSPMSATPLVLSARSGVSPHQICFTLSGTRA
jgi:hypothetical protein